MLIKNQKDFWAGILFICFGLGAVVVARENALGTLSRMGPAYFPTILGAMLAILGAVVSLRALVVRAPDGSGDLEGVSWGVLGFVLGSVAVFALTLLSCGLLISMALMVAVSSLANPSWRVKELAVLIVVLCVACWAIFVFGVGMQIPVWPTFF